LKDHALPSDNELRFLAELQEKQRSAEQNRVLGLPSRLARSLKSRFILTKQVTFTNLTDTKLAGANLTGAILANADLSDTRGSLERKQVERAIGNDKTKLPDSDEFKHVPPRWTSKGIEKQIKEIEAQTREESIKNMEEQIKKLHYE
jgi:pentapeptide repeat protein